MFEILIISSRLHIRLLDQLMFYQVDELIDVGNSGYTLYILACNKSDYLPPFNGLLPRDTMLARY